MRNVASMAAGISGACAMGAAMAWSQQPTPPPPPAPPPPPPPRPSPGAVPPWAPGSYHAWDPEASDNVLLYVGNTGDITLRNDSGTIVNNGYLRDGMVFWQNGKRSWLSGEGPGG